MYAQSTTAEFPSKISDWGTQSYLWLYASPWGNFIKLLCFLWWRTRWLTTTQLEARILFHMQWGITPLILRKAAANASPDTNPTNRASTSFPPIRALSPAPTLSNLELLIFLHSDRSRLMKAANKHFRIKKRKHALLTHLIVRFIVHFRVSKCERWVRAAGEAWILPRHCPRSPKSHGTFRWCRFMVFCCNRPSGVAAERVGETRLRAGCQASASRWLTDPELPQWKCLPCKWQKS